METYIALLRGVNVGGNNKIPMPLLRAALEGEGFAGVTTYINSGNAIFRSGEADASALQRRCREAIARAFSLDIPLALLSARELSGALSAAPDWWGADPDAKHNAIFVIAPASADAVMEAVGEAKPDYEQIAHSGRVIFWSAPLKTFSRTRWSKVVSTSAYADITIRNANTARKLLSLARAAQEEGPGAW